jgi:glycosyltransferase involved in cell wall biosynthesis
MAAGLPVVASDLPGMAEIIKPNINGMLFPKGDAPALAKILLHLANNPEQVARMAAATEPPLSVAGHAAQVEEIYRQMLGQTPAASIPQITT